MLVACFSAFAGGQDSAGKTPRALPGTTKPVRTGVAFEGRKHYITLAPTDPSNSDNIPIYDPYPNARIRSYVESMRKWHDSLMHRSPQDSLFQHSPRSDEQFNVHPPPKPQGLAPRRK